MIIGIPKELKDQENRVALLPEAVGKLSKAGHRVFLQGGAGEGSGYSDRDYLRAGAVLVPGIRELYRRSELVVKVKEPLPAEFPFFRKGLRLFCYLHLAVNPRLTRALQSSFVTALAFETLEDAQGGTPLLKPMSEIAGRLSVTLGAHFLQKNYGGRGVLLSPTHFSDPGRVVVIGAGSVGRAAAELAAGLGAQVTILDLRPKFHRTWVASFPRMQIKKSTPAALMHSLKTADLVVGAVYVHGARAPRVISEKMVRGMLSGSVLMDVAVDQGGVSETTRPTSISHPIYVSHGVIHCAITNMPALVSRTASQALSRTILPYVLKLARVTSLEALKRDRRLKTALNVCEGKIVHPGVAASGS